MYEEQRKSHFLLRIIVIPLIIILACILSPITANAESVYVTDMNQLKTAIIAAPTDGTECLLEIQDDITFDNAVSIPSGTNITIRGYSGDEKLTVTNARHFNVFGSLTLEDITLDGNKSAGGVSVMGGVLNMKSGHIRNNMTTIQGGGGGGGVYISGGTFNMEGGTISDNESSNGAGVLIDNGSTFNMSGGTISNNHATGGGDKGGGGGGGGGVYAASTSIISITGGSINDNKAAGGGGGIFVGNRSIRTTIENANIAYNSALSGGGIYVEFGGVLTIKDSFITGNIATSDGGGLHVDDYGTSTITDSTISDNNAASNGGGIYVKAIGTLDVAGNSYITGNNGWEYGGGIYTEDYADYTNLTTIDYKNLTLASTTVFDGNTASALYEPLTNVSTMYPNIGFASVSSSYLLPNDHPLNNYDINFIGETAKEEFLVTYYANGGTGGPYTAHIVSTDGDGNHTVLTDTDTGISRSGYTFTGWNTETDGSGTNYTPGKNITVDRDIDLYAEWKKEIVLDRENHFAYLIGYPEKVIQPENNITRAEAATIFFRMLTQQQRADVWSKSNSYPDVNTGDWHMNAISTLTNAGILYGYPNGSFGPDADITRAEFAAIAVKFNAVTKADTSEIPFSDISGHWAESEIELAARLGYVTGYEDGTFRPDAPITRAEVATLLNNVLNRHVSSETDMLPDMVTWTDNPSSKWYYLAIQEATNSHFFERKTDGINEIWTELRAVPDWAALEAPDAEPGDISY